MDPVVFGDLKSSGVSISWAKSRDEINVSGWYDHIVGIDCGPDVPTAKLLKDLGMKPADVRKIVKKMAALDEDS